MKKFLTVLLALSVVFTYTVGTAFADISADRDVQTEAAAKVSAELEKVKAAETLYLGTINSSAQTNPANLDVDKDIKYVGIGSCWFEINDAKKVTAKVVDEAEDVLNQQYATVINGTYNDDSALDAALATISASEYYGQDKFSAKASALSNLSALELQYAQERYIAVVNAVDESNYSDVVDENGDSNRSEVVELKKNAVSDIEDATNAYGNNGARAVAEQFLAAIGGIQTIADESYDAADLAAVKELAIAQMNAAYSLEKADLIAAENKKIRDAEKVSPQTDATKKTISDATERIATIEETYAAATVLLKDQINALTSLNDLNVYGADGNKWVIGTWSNGKFTPSSELTNAGEQYMALAVKKVAKIDALKADADLAKQFIGIEGSKYYSAEEVDNALDAAIAKVYPAKSETELNAITIEAMTPAQALLAKIKSLTGDNGKDKVVLDNKGYDTVAAWEKALDSGKYDYNGSEAVKADLADLIDATIDALYESTSIEEAENIFLEAYEKYDAFMTKTEYEALYAKGGELYAKTVSYEKQIEAAVDAKHTLVDPSGEYNFDKSEKFASNLITEMRTATSAAELDAKYAEAIATIDNLKTVETLTAEAKAMNDKAAVVDKTDKAAVTALMDEYIAFKDYIELIDSNKAYVLYDGRIKGYLQNIANAEAKAISDAIEAVGTVTVEDKEAIEKIVADKEALDALVEAYGLVPSNITVDALVKALSDAEIEAVIKAIATAEMTMDAANIAKIKDIQAAYEALKTSQKAQIIGATYDKYIALGKLADAYAQKVVAEIEGTHMKIYSSAAKGYIKISWKATNSEVTLDGVEVYRSTKKTTGFKKISTFKVQTSKKYTTGLKKGTKYYYYVVGYKMVDGEKVYTHQSITVARTFR